MKNKKITISLFGLAIVFWGAMAMQENVLAFSVSPMKQTVMLAPGDTYTGRVSAFVANEENGGEKMYYEASIAPIVIKDEGNQYFGVFDQMGDRNDIVNWTTISDDDEVSESGGTVFGSINPGEIKDFKYEISVPEDARGGGQYFAVYIRSVPNPDTTNDTGNVGIVDHISIASAVYAEVSGDIDISGSVVDGNIPSFLFSPPITASFVAKNDGNTHSEITYYLQVFPLFSDEEVYTTEEEPSSDFVLPDSSRFIQQSWDKTPSIGIFKVRQTVYYDSTDTTPSITEKIVVICPIWLLSLILFVIIALIIWIFMKVKGNKKRKSNATE